jgi:predicted nucleotidyltransferase
MDKRTAIKKVNEYINFLKKKKYNITKAYLFGSYVKGTYNDDSDIDIALVIEKMGDHFDTQVDLMKLRREFDTRIEPHPFAVDEFNESHPFASEILKSGIKV